MSSEKQEDKFIPISIPLNEILEDFAKYQDTLDKLRQGNNPYEDRDEKARGGLVSVGSLTDKDIRQPVEKEFRILLADSGMSRDQEIGFHLFIINSGVGPGAMSGDHLQAIEESEKWLDENLTPAEKRQMGR